MLREFTDYANKSTIAVNVNKVLIVKAILKTRKQYDDPNEELGCEIVLEGNIRIHTIESYEEVAAVLDNAYNS